MSYSQYKTIEQVQKQFGLNQIDERFVEPQDVKPSEQFLQDLQLTLDSMDVYASETARSEFIISPILFQLYKRYYKQYALWSQKPLVYDDQLTGTPDYLISKRSPQGRMVFESPFVVVIEAKRNDFELGWGQCLAEMVAAQKLNEDDFFPVYGVVTDGKVWEFGRLVTIDFTLNPYPYMTQRLVELFGALDYVLYTAGKQFNVLSDPPQLEPS